MRTSKLQTNLVMNMTCYYIGLLGFKQIVVTINLNEHITKTKPKTNNFYLQYLKFIFGWKINNEFEITRIINVKKYSNFNVIVLFE